MCDWWQADWMDQIEGSGAMPGTNRKSISEVEVNPSTLADLRWLLAECDRKEMPDSSTVEVKEHKSYDAREWEPARIKVRG